jgi:hypothetical protein
VNKLLAGPPHTAGAESAASHIGRHGPLPAAGSHFIDTLVQSRIAGRGGAGFAAGAKWRAVATHSRGNAVILVNGAEGEPQSQKDRLLMSTRPHLILDGAFIAARVLRARRVMLYIGDRHTAARNSMLRALAERPASERALVSAHTAPSRYVAGAESAAIHLINEGVATPTTMPPYPFERGVDGMPTLVQNVETLAQVALLARYGAPSGTSLVTVAGAVAKKGVLEVNFETTVGEAIKLAGMDSSTGCCRSAQPRPLAWLRCHRRFGEQPLPRLRGRRHHALPRERELRPVRTVLFWAEGTRRGMWTDRRLGHEPRRPRALESLVRTGTRQRRMPAPGWRGHVPAVGSENLRA